MSRSSTGVIIAPDGQTRAFQELIERGFLEETSG